MKTHVAIFVLLLFLTFVQETKVDSVSERKLPLLNVDEDSSTNLVSQKALNTSRLLSSKKSVNWLRHVYENSAEKDKSTTSKKHIAEETPNSLLNLLSSKKSNVNFKLHRLVEKIPKHKESNNSPTEIVLFPASVKDIDGEDTSKWETVNMTVFYNDRGVVKVNKVNGFNHVNVSLTNDPSIKSMNLMLKSKVLNIDPAVFSSIDPTVTSTKKGDNYLEGSKSENDVEKTQKKVQFSNTVDSDLSRTVNTLVHQNTTSNTSLFKETTNKDYLANSTSIPNKTDQTHGDNFGATLYALGAFILLIIFVIAYKLRRLLKRLLFKANCFNKHNELQEENDVRVELVDLAVFMQRVLNARQEA